MLDGDRLAAPDQLRAADAEALPAAARQVARLAVERAVPALHRQDAEPVADADAVELERARERRRRPALSRVSSNCERRAARGEVLRGTRRRS